MMSITDDVKKTAYVNTVFIGILCAAIYNLNPVQWKNLWDLWTGTDTYMHGLIVPFLVGILFKAMPSPNSQQRRSPLFLVVFAAMYLIAEAAMISTIQQLVLISSLPLILASVYGRAWLWHYRAPLLLWLLATPVGDAFIPTLQTWTADIAVFLLRLSSVDVLRNGWYLSIQNADFRVAEACSGLNFLVSTFTLTVFFSFMFIDSLKKRIAFILLGALLPIIANGIRVYLIIMVAHWGDVEAATGFDHLVYGWVFFVIVLGALLWVGVLIRDRSYIYDNNEHTSLIRWTLISWPLSILLIVVLFSLRSISFHSESDDRKLMAEIPEIGLTIQGATASQVSPDRWIISIDEENYNARLLSFTAIWFDEHRWTLKSTKEDIDHDGRPVVKYTLTNLTGDMIQVLVSYEVNGQFYSSRIRYKIAQTWSKLWGLDRGARATVYIVRSK